MKVTNRKWKQANKYFIKYKTEREKLTKNRELKTAHDASVAARVMDSPALQTQHAI